MSGKFADINGTRIYYEDVGSGDPIIFSHCLLWNTTLYDAQVEALRAEYRCISYDHRGQGRSADHVCNEISVEMLVRDVVALIDHLKLPPVHFVGHSLGGFVGIMLAARHPELVRRLVLCSTSGDEEPSSALFRWHTLNFAGRIFSAKLLADAILPTIFPPEFLKNAERRAKAREVLAANRRTAWRAVNGVINRPSQHSTLASIRTPTLVITSPHDTMRPPHEGERIAAGIPGAQLVCLPTGCHMLPLEQPEVITDLIRNFLSAQ